ncbi:hypothetical protein DXG03_001168 [Asterophora parasitica]|uniref:UDP-N-acetylglucosamine transferase subunit ALG13 n=1 Tax=Asterophora parasitica TaxID=117018 RepID=A0A9P7GCR6_9AGAR|nr:hypothetical protein DXG03_001168 [Asterophora parasitica]
MLAFVTVGSTRFDSLVQAALSPPVLTSLHRKGYHQLVVQCGNSAFEFSIGDASLALVREGVHVEVWKFKPTLQEEYERADLVISHAGSGTILDVLRLGKPLIVVANPTLLDNHQQELAGALSGLGHLVNAKIPGSYLVLMPPKAVAPVVINGNPQIYEDKNVHAIYDEIASHFSSTRYKVRLKPFLPWPIISAFMSSIATGWVGLDAGTGNGKYLPLPLDRPTDILTVGLDRSINLLKIARNAGESGTTREVVWGDVLGQSWRTGVFDYAISIATIHHLATHERRIQAVKRLLQSVSPQHGRILIYVWAIEQDELSKREIPIGENGDSEGLGQDVVVPWVLSKKAPATGTEKRDGPAEQQVFNRYYHMFAKGELRGLVHDAAKDLGLHMAQQPMSTLGRGVEIVQDGWERSNYYIELKCWEIPE